MIINLVKNYLENMQIEDLNNLAIKHNINLSENELNFTYSFIKNHYEAVLKNPANFDFREYAEYYSEENFQKINQLIKKYYSYL